MQTNLRQIRGKKGIVMGNAKDSISRIETYIDKLSQFSFRIGKARGVTRLAFSPQETAAIYWAEKQFRNFGYECKEDAFLNLHAYDPREGNKRILVGTHLDTVKNGGKYDGTVGLVSFLEALHLRKESGKFFSLPVDFVIFRAEESTIFKEALLGSKIATGRYSLEKLKDIIFSRDEELLDAMIHLDYLEKEPVSRTSGEESASFPSISLFDILFKHTTKFLSEIRKDCWFFDHKKEEYKAYFEIHIEQSKVLEWKKMDLGIVTSFRAPLRKVFTLQGVTDHSGATPMNNKKRWRRDALCAASECIVAIERICQGASKRGADIVGTVGEITVPYSGINKVPGVCKFSIDLRSENSDERKEIYDKIEAEIRKVCETRDIGLEIDTIEEFKPVSLYKIPVGDDPESRKRRETVLESKKLRKKMEKVIEKLGITYMPIPSGAGHDAMLVFNAYVPVCMLFIPCKSGISHSPYEEAKAEDILKVSRVLLSILTSRWAFAEDERTSQNMTTS